MKKPFFKNRLLTVAAACLLTTITLSSCKDDDVDTNGNVVEYENVAVNGAQEFPPVATARVGTFNGTYNKTTKVLTYTVAHNVTDAVAAHFHEAPRDSSGSVVIPIAAPVDAITNRTATLTAAQESDLLRGRLYVNIHSPAFPAGEIRGQIPAE